ncbi:MAG: HD-GYP domain-containing protein [Clostridia bacterium]|nr:HD-GYP domain-containing protein [Clostridia bacterium]
MVIKVPVSELKPGMKLAKDVHLEDGRILLLSGFAVKQRYIRKLELFNIEHVYIEEGEAVPLEELREEKVYAEAFNTIKHVLSSVREGKELDVHAVKETVSDIVQRVINNESVFMQLTGIRDIDNYTFLHSVDVCIYSVVTGKNLGLSKTDLTELGIGAILHDIGKCKIPLEVLMKPGRLTEDEFHVMKLHTIYGHEIISNTPGLNKRVANIACQHHEKWDGTGYPVGLSNYQIDKFARIVTIADIYDALTADRVYKKKDLPHEAAEYLMCYSSVLVDPEITKLFIKNIAFYPAGSIVLLNTGEIGSVIEANKHVSIRPKIRVIARKEGPPVFEPYELDLVKNPSIFIIDILG